ncbi:alternate-type signal peptide domain-containing protein [Planctomonas psychrotolerans]|uniref:alternate-type signal peptide domain-containing protein n=1 Tax=Planctomonas psychrotolerans TaxID=2528712 RepID=UPI001D0D65E0|nr:alternate-type signal peptide domain-containing protein [Planctomonas psychrotolerans]
MNKLLKGAIAGTAGVVLLLGGGGTFALWNAEQSVNLGTIESGMLSLDAVPTGTWKDISSDAAAGGEPIADITAFRMVPGDTLELTQVVHITAVGDNLRATLQLDPAQLMTGQSPEDWDLMSRLVYSSRVDTVVGGTVTKLSDFSYAVLPSTTADGATTLTIKATVALPANAVSGSQGSNGTVDLSKLAITVTQDPR